MGSSLESLSALFVVVLIVAVFRLCRCRRRNRRLVECKLVPLVMSLSSWRKSVMRQLTNQSCRLHHVHIQYLLRRHYQQQQNNRKWSCATSVVLVFRANLSV